MKEQIHKELDLILQGSLLGQGFTFRPGQRETIQAICEAYYEDPEATIVIDAPTGTGKSIIAMASSLVLSRLGNKGYLVTSDLMLQDQYESDIYKLKLHWPSIKGVDNYECSVNGQPFSLGDCKLKGMGYEQASRLHCYSHCEYLQNRKRAIESTVCLLNYSYWLIQRNYVEKKMTQEQRPVPFERRDFVFFDEAHKVDEVVQSHFTPRVDRFLVDKMVQAENFLLRNQIEGTGYTKTRLQNIVSDVMMLPGKAQVFEAMEVLERVLIGYNKAARRVKKEANRRFKGHEVSKDWQKAMTTFERIKDTRCKVQDYLELIREVGVDKMVIDHQQEETKTMCVEEAKMIKKYLHEKAGFKVFMSATIGDPNTYMKLMGIENARFIRLGNQFDYTKSPIVFVNRFGLSHKEKEMNLPKVIQLLDQIIDKHKGQKGIVHTGSYDFKNRIIKDSKHVFRLMHYDGSKEKEGAFDTFKNSKEDKVLIGPSLLEGLDLKDDTSRFQVFFKVPYPSMVDPLIKAKMEASREWYNWKTSVSILQGVGRSVRNEEDWAVTYIIDASFGTLMYHNRDAFPPSFTERLKVVK